MTLIIAYKATNNRNPVYLQELIHIHVPLGELRSDDKNMLSVRFTKSAVIQNCAFSVAGPRLWNILYQSASELLLVYQNSKPNLRLLFSEYYG